MAKFHGPVGFVHHTETAPGVWSDGATEKMYYGDVKRNSRKLIESTGVNDDITVQNSVSIMADAYANENILAIRYVRWAGSLYSVRDVVVERPRLTLRLGGVYNGPTA